MRPLDHALPDVNVEDSFVLAIDAEPGVLTFHVDFALFPSHPSYSPPPPTDAHCFHPGTITCTGVRNLTWINQSANAAVDASGELDYGSFDELQRTDRGWVFAGEWGRIVVDSPNAPRVQIGRDVTLLA